MTAAPAASGSVPGATGAADFRPTHDPNQEPER
jgi:hypothetical protein